ncbi:transmembrane anterior posterior transformation protein 1 homolog [Littorina saxatilis]|uniref:Uncharacterized protein n=1 Tax=Littorina saxatilis TaxID=31220 RepID=A0AAN9BT75_9CAEN
MADIIQTSKVSSKLPTKSEIPPRLRHRSRCSESENGTTEMSGNVSPTEGPQADGDQPKSRCEELKLDSNGGHDSAKPPPNPGDVPGCSKQGMKPYKSVLSLLGFELTRGYYLSGDESHYEERRERVYTFMSTPIQLEKFCLFGFLQCVDTFLFFTAFLPLRVVIATMHMFSFPCAMISTMFQEARSRRWPQFLQPAQMCDLLKGLLLGLSCFVIDYIDTSRMYHLVRGQAVIKLYVFYNMLDLADRLVSGAGQDMLDALYWTATEPGRKRRRYVFVVFHFVLALGYILLHTMVILAQATVLNVAFNSHNKSLLTIMISNNFVEIKGNLFKRMDKNNLLQISCSDVKERFHLAVLLFVVFIRNMTEFNWNPDQAWEILPDTVYVILAEILVDSVKHAFITKFNEISADTYRTFKLNLAQDILTSQKKYAHTDYSDQVCRRLGLAPIPLACVLVQMCSKSIHFTGIFTYLLLALFYLCLVCTKVLTSILLLSWAWRLLEEAQDNGNQTNPCNIDSQVLAKKDVSANHDPPPRDSQGSERSSPLKHAERIRSISVGPSFPPMETVCTNFGLANGGDGVDHELGWHLHSVSDTVLDRQLGSLHRDLSPSPVSENQTTEWFLPTDKWEVDSLESETDFHSSVGDNAALQSQTATDTPVVDFDEEKKYK